jgi:hypothetical protein
MQCTVKRNLDCIDQITKNKNYRFMGQYFYGFWGHTGIIRSKFQANQRHVKENTQFFKTTIRSQALRIKLAPITKQKLSHDIINIRH